MRTLEQDQADRAVTGPTGSYFAVPLEHLRTETVLGFDLFIHHGPHAQPVLYRSRALPFTREVLERLVNNGVRELLVPGEQRHAYRSYREEHEAAERRVPEVPPADPRVPSSTELALPALVDDTAIPLRSRAATLLGVSRSVIEIAMSDLATPGLGERVQRVAEATARFILNEPRSFSVLVSLLETDLDTYHHSLRTSLYTAQLARALGMADEVQMSIMARAALVHDIGRGDLPLELLHKTGGMSDLDWAEVTGHPIRGTEMLRDAGFDDPVCLDVCANHHERCDGSGYPQGLHREQISIPARMVAITDIFDSLTSSGKNHVALSGFQALWRLKQDMRGQFDPHVLDVFIKVMVAPVRA